MQRQNGFSGRIPVNSGRVWKNGCANPNDGLAHGLLIPEVREGIQRSIAPKTG
jgi:hypothetical protein